MDEANEAPLNVLEERLAELRKRIMTLEWDKSHNQLNSSMEAKYLEIKVEFESLQKKVEGMKAEAKAKEPAEPSEPPQAETATKS